MCVTLSNRRTASRSASCSAGLVRFWLKLPANPLDIGGARPVRDVEQCAVGGRVRIEDSATGELVVLVGLVDADLGADTAEPLG